jgi:hypothetical protein
MGALYYLDWERSAGFAPTNNPGGEIIVKFDWRQLANNDYSTFQVAGSLSAILTSTNFISELGGHSLSELPIHLIGHSRGGSLVCETSRLLGKMGVWVDQITTLDPHPLNDPAFLLDPIKYSVIDAPALTYENVLFHDNYFQTFNIIASGLAVPGAYRRQLLSLDGGYEGGLTASHSDAHLWYHGTIDLRPFDGGPGPASDTEAFLGNSERMTWYSTQEVQGISAGFYFSRLGGGDRTSSDRPFGTPGDMIKDGFNQLWELGAGHVGNRTRLISNAGNWPNVMKLNVTSTNVVSQGQNISLKIYLQWARSVGSTGTLEFYCDDDLNPLNGNSRLIKEFTFQSNGPDNIGIYPVDLLIDSMSSPVGDHAVYAKIQAEGKTRYLYAPEILTVLGAPVIAISRVGQQWTIGVDSKAGQKIVIDTSTNLSTWIPMTTNQLASDRWVYTPAQQAPETFRFYRARTVP